MLADCNGDEMYQGTDTTASSEAQPAAQKTSPSESSHTLTSSSITAMSAEHKEAFIGDEERSLGDVDGSQHSMENLMLKEEVNHSNRSI